MAAIQNQPRSISAGEFDWSAENRAAVESTLGVATSRLSIHEKASRQAIQSRAARNGKVTNVPENRFHQRGLRYRAKEINLKSDQVTLLARAARERQMPATRSNNGKAWDRLYVLLNSSPCRSWLSLAVLWPNGR
jgi:hypothetical protein